MSRHPYTATKWETALTKEKFEKQFKKFVSGGFKLRDFPRWFYQRLSTCFGHIAHYNQGQFYETFFTTPEDQQMFVDQTLQYVSVGDPAWTYSDVERELQPWLRAYWEKQDERARQIQAL